MEHLRRTPEPHELMDDQEQALAYAESDFSQPHTELVRRFKGLFPDFQSGVVLDIGVGHADPTIRFAKEYPHARFLGIDGAEAMLAHGRLAVEREGLSERIALRRIMLQEDTFESQSFDAVVSNSLLHHLDDPLFLWRAIKKIAKPGAPIYIVDLARPQSSDEARRLVDLHAARAPELMRRDFYNSLHAAFRPDEVREQLDAAGLATLEVNQVSDRHIVVHGRG